MDTIPTSASAVELLVAARQADGSHTADRLATLVRTGRALRVRRGVYIRPADWIQAKPWQRYRIATAATALDTDPIFCRETALLLHGAPLIRTPATVLARTMRMGGTGKIAPPALTGQMPLQQFREKYQGQHRLKGGIEARRLRNVPNQLLRPPQIHGITRPEMMEGLRAGTLTLHETTIGSRPEMGIRGPDRYRAEPLELALIDTIPRMPFEEAVTVLDWVKAQHRPALESWSGYLANGRMRRRWERAWEFSTAQSESPGESRSRALIAELGYAPPALQVAVSTDRGPFRTDFCWREDGVVGEFDGRLKYVDEDTLNGRDPKEVLFQEKQREDALRRAGWTVVRWTWEDLNHPTRLAAYLKSAGVTLGN